MRSTPSFLPALLLIALPLSIALSASSPAQTRPATAPSTAPATQSSTTTFTAEVSSIETLANFKGQAIATGVDPRYVVVIQNITVQTGNMPLAPDKIVSFAIHSPSQLFADNDAPIHRKFKFTLLESNGFRQLTAITQP